MLKIGDFRVGATEVLKGQNPCIYRVLGWRTNNLAQVGGYIIWHEIESYFGELKLYVARDRAIFSGFLSKPVSGQKAWHVQTAKNLGNGSPPFGSPLELSMELRLLCL